MPNQKVRLFISNEFYHHHADGILEKYNDIKDFFVAALASNVTLEFINRKKGLGINSTSLNKGIRALLSDVSDILFEVNQKDGVYYISGQTNGFDFAIIDSEQNLLNFRNLCFGSRTFENSDRLWKDFLRKNPKYNNIVAKLSLPNPTEKAVRKDLPTSKVKPIILGEIQFGNWALAYRDLFKVLQANILTEVDVLIYIVADGTLSSRLSDGTVNFIDTKKIIEEFAKVITVPIWIIGLDYR